MVDATIEMTAFMNVYDVLEANLLLYERIGILSPQIYEGRNFYTVKDGVRVKLIEKGKRLGFSLSEMKRLIESRAPSPPE